MGGSGDPAETNIIAQYLSSLRHKMIDVNAYLHRLVAFLGEERGLPPRGFTAASPPASPSHSPRPCPKKCDQYV